MTEARLPAAATIVARNYLPAARVLADSYRRHHRGARFAVLVVDVEPDELATLDATAPGIRFLGPHDLALDAAEFGRMALAYSVTELCTAVKPWLLRRLLDDHPVAIYLDPDIEVFSPFADRVAELATEHGIVLTPHVLEPMPRDGLRPSEADIMASGVFNLGFIAVSADAESFLQFWADRLRQDAISSITEQLFTDQRWVDNVPAMFRHTVITDPGYNVAYWNVYQRPLAKRPNGTISAGEVPLRFLHYSGYRPERPWLVSAHFADRPRVLLSDRPLLAELFTAYRTKLIDAGYAKALEDVPYRWNELPDGTAVSASLRRAFRQAWVDAERRGSPAPPNPFGPGGAADFLRWATSPANPEQERAGLSRWAMALWQSRTDLRQAFADPLHAHAEDFRAWCLTSAVSEGELPERAVNPEPRPETVPVRDTVGANVLGYLTAELGVGEMGRLVHDAVVASGLPVATAVEEFTVSNRTSHPLPPDAAIGDPHFGVSVLCVNADMTHTTLRLHPELGRDRYVIGVWSWELSTFPPSMHPIFDLVDEVWTISDFCAVSLGKHASAPVHTFPVPVRDPLSGSNASLERRAPAPGDPVRFLFVFDHNSVLERKNPLGVISAFTRAFGDRDDVRLVIKSINGDLHPGDRERLRLTAAGDTRIELVEGYLGGDELRKLYTSADCYVSLHRSEGFGLTVAEAMAHGLPVIATDYSGTSEVLTADTGWPIPYRLVSVGPGNAPYPADAHWAEPDLDAAVAALREVADGRDLALRRGAAARRHVLTTRSESIAARWVRERIEAAHQEWLARRNRRAARGPLGPMRTAREALKWRADPTTASRLPMASTLRRAVLRAIDHYDHHQRTMLTTLMDGVEASAGQLAQLQERTAEQLERVERRLAALQAAQTAMDTAIERRLGEKDTTAAEMERKLDTLRGELVGRVDELDRKVIGLLAERDRKLTTTDAATHELRAELDVLREGLLRHHDLVNPAPATASQAVATDVGLLRLPAEDTVVLPWLRRYGTWEAAESRLVEALLPAGGVFVDIGAHVGYFTVRGLHKVGTTGRVFAVEPWQQVRDLLELNVAANVRPDDARALVLLDCAAWDEDGPLRLALADDGNSGDNRIDPAGDIEVSGRRLDGVAELAAREIDVVKSDAQGRDHHALAGMTGLFDRHRPHILCEFWPEAIEQAGDDPFEVLRRYRSWGYQPLPLTEQLVATVEAGGTARVPSAGPLPTDHDLVHVARSVTEGFVTLWLRPQPA